MKNVFIFLFLMLAKSSVAQQPVVLKGNITNLEGHPIVIATANPTIQTIKRIDPQNGQFEVAINVAGSQELAVYPYRYDKNAIRDTARRLYYRAPMLELFVVPGDTITITGDAMKLWTAAVRGGALEKEYKLLRSQMLPVITEGYMLSHKEYRYKVKNNQVKAAKIKERRSLLEKEKKEITKRFYTGNTSSEYAFYKFSQSIKSLQPQDVVNIFNSYSPALRESDIGKRINLFIEKYKSIGSGKRMIDFSGKTLTGKMFNTEDLRRKYVLLDFWGSWCGPRRKSNPHLKELYAKYKGRGFEIVGIAQEMMPTIEKSKVSLQKAVKEDGLPWVQLLNNELKEKVDVVEAYNVSAFPTKVLIDKNGAIVWKGIGSEEAGLYEQLVRIFGE